MINAKAQSIVYLNRLVKIIDSLLTIIDRGSDEINFKAQLYTLFVTWLTKCFMYRNYM